MTEMEALAQAIQQLAQEIKSGGGGGGGDSSIFQKLASTAGLASTAMEAFAGIQFGKAIEGFVGALSPSAVQVFDRALNDLAAVAGTALMPVFFTLTGAVKQFSNLMLPVAQELAPVLGALADTVMSILQPVMQTFANAISLMIPAFRMAVDAVSLITPAFQALETVWAAAVRTAADMAASLFGGNYKTAVEQAQNVMQKFANGVVIAAGSLAKFVASMGFKPAEMFLKNLIEATKGGRQQDAAGLGAATQGRVTDIRSFEREQMAAAFTATQGGGDEKKSQEAYLAEANGMLTKLNDGTISIKDALKEMEVSIVRSIALATMEILNKLAGDTFGVADPAGWADAIAKGLAGIRPPGR